MSGQPAATVPGLLADLLRRDPGRPFVTAYDEASGERTELSVATYANWVAKTANLLVEDYLLGDGDTIRVALPAHWLSTVFLGAAWSAGIAVTTDPAATAHLLVTGPVADPEHGSDVPVLACALLPFAVRFPDPLADGVDDYGELWPGQPDVFVPSDQPVPATVGWRQDDTSHTQAELLELAAKGSAGWSGDRLITDTDPTTSCSVPTLLAALVRGGSLVLVRNPADEQWPARLRDERATDVLRSDSA